MRFAWLAAGATLLVVGVVWIFQGVGSLGGSFMSGNPAWVWVGVGAVAVSVPLLVRGVRR
jgi:uncharacterized membrane protein